MSGRRREEGGRREKGLTRLMRTLYVRPRRTSGEVMITSQSQSTNMLVSKQRRDPKSQKKESK